MIWVQALRGPKLYLLPDYRFTSNPWHERMPEAVDFRTRINGTRPKR